MNPSEPTNAPKRRWLPSPAGVTGVVLAGLVIYGVFRDRSPDPQTLQAVRDRVDACWNESRRATGTGDQQREKTAECQRLDSAFRKQFGGTP